MRALLLISFLFFPGLAAAQFAPQAGQTGSTAVHRLSGKISVWANSCSVIRGLQYIAQPGSGYASVGDSSLATGPADGAIVSLGDSGVAILTFAQPIANAPGMDIAVFENGFINPSEGHEAFLEVAFVEISSDGVTFHRFPAQCTVQDTIQIPGAGTYTDARKLHNLAGKYAAPYGVPFDFDLLAGKPGLNISAITHVRIVDAIGSIGDHATTDATGHKINDPYPTAFPSGGFDLDAVAVLHGTGPDVVEEVAKISPLHIFPNPATRVINLRPNGNAATNLSVVLYDALGRMCRRSDNISAAVQMDVQGLARGLYSLHIFSTEGDSWRQHIVIQ